MTRFEIARRFSDSERVESATDEIEERGVRERDVTRVSVVARANDARPRGGVLRLRLGYHRGEDGSSVGRGAGEVFGRYRNASRSSCARSSGASMRG